MKQSLQDKQLLAEDHKALKSQSKNLKLGLYPSKVHFYLFACLLLPFGAVYSGKTQPRQFLNPMIAGFRVPKLNDNLPSKP